MGSITVYPSMLENHDDGTFSALHYDYQSLALGMNAYNEASTTAWIRFRSCTIPAGMVITSAVMTFCEDMFSGGTTVNVRIYGNDVNDATYPSTKEEGAALVLTTAYVDWNNIPAKDDHVYFDSPDFKAVVQEIYDRAGKLDNVSVMILVKNNGSSSGAGRRGHDVDAGAADRITKLVVAYAPRYVPKAIMMD
jgi:hypothetical protein